MKRFALAALLALVPLLPFGALSPVASAGSDDWCDTDPLVLINTPAGNVVPVYNLIAVQGLIHEPDFAITKVSYTTKSVNLGTATQVTLNVTVPNDLFGSGFPTRTTVSTGPWGTLTVLGSTTGTAGSAMTVRFTVPVP